MRWLDNRRRRNLTNRVYQRACRDFGSPGYRSAIYAVAIAAAVYPQATYESEQWDCINATLPKPIIKSRIAKRHAESYAARDGLDLTSCIFSLYGCSIADLMNIVAPEESNPICSDRDNALAEVNRQVL